MVYNSHAMRLIFMGTPQFALPTLEELIKSKEFKPLSVVTMPDKPVGRKHKLTSSPVKLLAQKHHIPALQPQKIKDNKEFTRQIKKLDPELIVVIAYGKIIPKEILEIPKLGIINVHASLLPKYRGPSPIQAAILEGDSKTGVVIMKIDEQMDTGDILSWKEINITARETAQTLHNKLAAAGAKLLMETLPKYINEEIKPQPQDNSLATYCKIITREDGKVFWNKPSQYINRQVRAFTPWPGAFTFCGDSPPKRIKIIDVKEIERDSSKEEMKYGQVVFSGSRLLVKTGDGWLSIVKLQIEGGKLMTAQEFMNGHRELNKRVLI